MISHGRAINRTLPEIVSKVSESEIISHYIGVDTIPCVINSPLREDRNPSFGLYTLDGEHIFYKDLSTKDAGGTFKLLSRMWGVDFQEALNRVYKEMVENNYNPVSKTIKTYSYKQHLSNSASKLDVEIRDWQDYDLEYWGSYGITLDWLKWAEVYPISYIIISKEGKTYTFPAEKLAYAYVERKEGNISIKVYQPLVEDRRRKWYNKHDRSVISLWTKIPEYGDKVVICSSLKDALCLSANTGIPALSVQGEGFTISDTALNELIRRFNKQYICFDNDSAGTTDAIKLAKGTGFTNLVIPPFEGGKDISDLYKVCGKEKFIEIIKQMFKDSES